MLRQILNFVLVVILVVGVYKMFGGDLGSFVTMVGDVLINVVDAGSDVVADIGDAIFG